MTKQAQTVDYGNPKDLASQVAKLLGCDLSKISASTNDASGTKPPFSAKDFSTFDHLHSRGRAATQELSEFLSVNPGSNLLDIGCGIGGPARFIAERFVCHVHGLDITKEFCETAELLNRLCGLDKRIKITHGNALSLPFDGCSFDTVWSQHTSMNIASKKEFYTEINRVLKPGGTFLFHDIFLSEGLHSDSEREILLPIPWASKEEHNHLVAGEVTRDLMGDLGFHREIWNDVTAETHLWFHNYNASQSNSRQLAKGLNPTLFIGKNFPERAKNLKQNLALNKLVVVQAVFRKR